jgi:hypothetical protein
MMILTVCSLISAFATEIMARSAKTSPTGTDTCNLLARRIIIFKPSACGGYAVTDFFSY